ncbi:MAG: adenylyltransferase/cytidyltransferase family protein [Deltaproteobacteria bacterium]|nr:adenylyltransferase/cytidyltransferase family protein [Deltaproteobacteria bacterium]
MEEAKIILDHHELRSVISEHQRHGRKVVFTNGCFDLIHVGHIRCLKGAKEEGDVLVVGVNSDASVIALGKEGRPLMPEQERLEILSSVVYVDYLTIFSDPTVDGILKLLRPDVFAKGTDYTVENVPERDTAFSIQARIAIVGDPKDHSSTEYMKRINRMGE